MDKKLWSRIGLIATVCLVPGGMIIGATLAARRYRQQQDAKARAEAEDAAESDQSEDQSET
ncbi:hypothetical protein G4G27_19440 [Sphingomonas sp. So64.6b]|uniref:hypothetical protein n=1 Tax=Sphingomonas sp. So64.6b TaxID=2997354 RepID=UPI0016007C9E|nr:hypothetical protein [Sphingomonas sp. So64.6b]QNA82569.1 hypothetical protein G4G27_19440 [Sphingomonas sp. So64.6b]